MKKDQSDMDAQFRRLLDELGPFPPRNPQAAGRGRAQFLSQAVSASELRRHRGWKIYFRKERFSMNLWISILVIAGLLFGGGATVGAAQDDLPNEPLYYVKTLSEDMSVQFRNEPQQKVERLMELAQIRIHEMARLTEEGHTTPGPVHLRLEQHIQQALQICSTLDDAALEQALLQVRDRLQEQERDLEQMQLYARPDSQPLLTQTRTMTRLRLQLVMDGLADPALFRRAVQNGFRYGQAETATPTLQRSATPQSDPATSTPVAPAFGPSDPQPAPGGPNPDPGGPNSDPGDPNMIHTPSMQGNGPGPGGNGSGGGSNNDDSSGGGGGTGPGPGSGGGGNGSGGSGGNRP